MAQKPEDTPIEENVTHIFPHPTDKLQAEGEGEGGHDVQKLEAGQQATTPEQFQYDVDKVERVYRYVTAHSPPPIPITN